MTRFKRILLSATLLALLLVSVLPVAGCTSDTQDAAEESTAPSDPAPTEEENADEPDDQPGEPSALAWADIALVDVQTGETFTIGEQGEGPVLLQAFAVW